MPDEIEEKNDKDIEKLNKSVRDLYRLVIELSDRVTALEDGYKFMKNDIFYDF